MSQWKLDGKRLILKLNEAMLEESRAQLDRESEAFFSFEQDDYEKRILLYYEGREFPSYLEAEHNHSYLSWSKALDSRILGVFPNYKEYFKEDRHEDVTLSFEMEDQDAYRIRLHLPWSVSLDKKQAFFDQIGILDSTDNFEDAYEIVFLREFFSELSNRGQSDAFMVSAKLKKYFENRLKEAGEQDRDALKQIENINSAGLDDVLAFLMDGPYKKYSESELMALKQNADHFVFQLSPDLMDEISTDDRSFLVDLLDKKLEAYFDRQNAPSLSESLDAFIMDYQSFFGKDFRYSFKDVILQAIPAGIANTGIFEAKEFMIKGFAGTESWALVPYIRITPKNPTQTPVHILYFLDKDKMKLYLGLMLDTNQMEREIRRSQSGDIDDMLILALSQTVRVLRDRVDAGNFETDSSPLDFLDPKMKSAMIAHIEYTNGAPDQQKLENDLNEAKALFDQLTNLPDELPEETAEETQEAEVIEETAPATDEVSEETEESEKTEDVPAVEEAKTAEAEQNTEEKPEAKESKAEETEPAVEPSATSAVQEEAKPEEKPEVAEIKEVTSPKPVHSSLILDAIGRTSDVIRESQEHQQAPKKEEPAPKPVSFNETIEHLKKEMPKKEVINFYRPKNAKEGLTAIAKSMRSAGIPVDDELVSNIYLSLKSVPLLAVTGSTVSDRDEFIRSYAKAAGADAVNGRFMQVRLRNQTDPMKVLFGDGTIPGILPSMAEKAAEQLEAPYFLYLKDLRLAEDYDVIGELLALMDSRHIMNGYIVSDPLYIPGSAPGSTVRLPENLFVLVSTDSSKTNPQFIDTLDHIGLIHVPEFSLQAPKKEYAAANIFGTDFFKSEYLSLAETADKADQLAEVIVLLDAMNGVLSKADARIGRRLMDEICLYLLYNNQEGLMSQEKALDYTILQKVLPRISGSGKMIESALIDLFKICAGTKSEIAARHYNGQGGLFPNTAAKLSKMVNYLDQNQFTHILV